MRVGDDLAVVALGGEQAPRPGVDAQRLGPAELDAAVGGRAGGQLGHGRGHVVGGHELHLPGGEPDGVALGAGLDDLGQELEELRGAQDRVRDVPRLDLGLLGDLGAQVPAVGQELGPDDADREVVTDARGALGREEVARRGGEERQDRVVLPGRRVGDVDDDVGARHHVGEAVAADGVHARRGRRRHRVVPLRGQPPDDVAPDPPAPTDDNDLHGLPSGCV